MTHKCIAILGYSGAGKDWVAKSFYPGFRNYKINQTFKDIFELDHELEPGVCNIKQMREHIIKTGPKAGLTIRHAMVEAFAESEGSNPEAYGYQFKSLPVCPPQADCVVTDVRKITEAMKLVCQPYKHSAIVVNNPFVISGLLSDQALPKIVEFYKESGFKVSSIENAYDSRNQPNG